MFLIIVIYIYVEDDTNKFIQYHKQFEWLIFDDAKLHYAENPSNTDRLILMLDVERPDDIEIGKSKIEYSKELNDIIDYYKALN